MSWPRGVPSVPGVQRDGQRADKAANPVYRSFEGALGRAWRLSRTTGRNGVVWAKGARSAGSAQYVVHVEGAPSEFAALIADGWRDIASVAAVES